MRIIKVDGTAAKQRSQVELTLKFNLHSEGLSHNCQATEDNTIPLAQGQGPILSL